VDKIRSEISNRIFMNFNNTPTVLGGISVPGEVIFTAHGNAGRVTGATPDGRLKGTVLADSAGACQGKDICGPTALLNSILKIPVKDFLLTSIVINIKFLTSLFNGSKEKIKILFQTFFENGGMQLQVNVVDAKTLEKAMERPEEYRSLVVRVGGYSDYFVNLPESLQREIILRTSQAV
jgi:pyruvate-formate lyase